MDDENSERAALKAASCRAVHYQWKLFLRRGAREASAAAKYSEKLPICLHRPQNALISVMLVGVGNRLMADKSSGLGRKPVLLMI